MVEKMLPVALSCLFSLVFVSATIVIFFILTHCDNIYDSLSRKLASTVLA